jgi:hypothetical protein
VIGQVFLGEAAGVKHAWFRRCRRGTSWNWTPCILLLVLVMNDGAGLPYRGAMKLTEALMGQDLFGFHSA